MNFFVWNCRGLGNPETVRELHDLVKMEGPALVFLCETKIEGRRVSELTNRLGFEGCYLVNSADLSGGLALFWSKVVDVTLNNFSDQHIDVMVKNISGDNKVWRFTGFYAKARRSERAESWNFLRWLKAQSDAPWLCGGDFNDITHNSEYFGAHDRPEWQMDGFRQCLDDCELQDMGYQGVPFTWDNMQHGDSNVKVRLDRFLMNPAMMSWKSASVVKHVLSPKSDHCMLAVNLKRVAEATEGHKRRFIYEEAWQKDETYDTAVLQGWRRGAGLQGLHGIEETLSTMQTQLASWKTKKFGDIRRKIKKIRKEY